MGMVDIVIITIILSIVIGIFVIINQDDKW